MKPKERKNQSMKMSIKKVIFLPALIATLGLISAGRVTAQTFTTLYSFTNGSDGGNPYSGVILSDNGNTLYGTAYRGGSSHLGTVFAVNINGNGLTTLHSFVYSSDGANPDAGLILSGNTLYGTAYRGGSSGNGTVFAINIDTWAFTNLHSFTALNNNTNSDGANPDGGLILSGNTLYGTANNGGSSGDDGTVFAVNTDGTGFTNLHSFNGGSDGANPQAGLILSGNTLYGTANSGGSSGHGTVFAVNTDGTGFTTLHSFIGGSDGANPVCALILSGNTLYGETDNGGSPRGGTLFAVNTNGMDFTTLYNFTGGKDGAGPVGVLLLLGNTLYGTAILGGSGSGTVFTVNTNGSNFMTWYSFTNGSDGNQPYAGLILSGTNLYGTAAGGGSSNYGTIFSLSVETNGAPTISGQPQSQTAGYNQTAAFRVYANGYPPMTYQWYFTGTNDINETNVITGATNAVLTLADLQTNNDGCYTVAVTDPSGTTFSSPACLNLLPFIGINLVPALSLNGVMGDTYNLQYINAFGPTNAPWTTLATVTLTNRPQFYPDYSAIGQPVRYYRIVQVP